MCTATWLSRNGSLHLFFNRDEQRSREAAVGPGLHESEGVRFLAPSDGRAGGTWIAVTELGLALALLNRSEGSAPSRPGSRGRLIPRLAAAPGPDDFASRLLREPLRDLSPFRLVALWADSKSGALATWDGDRLRLDKLEAQIGILCSSGLGDERAEEERGRVWREHRAATEDWGPSAHRAFHRSHDPEPTAWSVCMHRSEAETMSFAEVEIDATTGVLSYVAGAPCAGGRPVELRLPRATPVGTR